MGPGLQAHLHRLRASTFYNLQILKLEITPNVDFLEFLHAAPNVELRTEEFDPSLYNILPEWLEENLDVLYNSQITFNVDITVQSSVCQNFNDIFRMHNGLRTTQFVNDWLKVIPELQHMILITKDLFRIHDFNKAYQGSVLTQGACPPTPSTSS